MEQDAEYSARLAPLEKKDLNNIEKVEAEINQLKADPENRSLDGSLKLAYLLSHRGEIGNKLEKARFLGEASKELNNALTLAETKNENIAVRFAARKELVTVLQILGDFSNAVKQCEILSNDASQIPDSQGGRQARWEAKSHLLSTIVKIPHPKETEAEKQTRKEMEKQAAKENKSIPLKPTPNDKSGFDKHAEEFMQMMPADRAEQIRFLRLIEETERRMQANVGLPARLALPVLMDPVRLNQMQYDREWRELK